MPKPPPLPPPASRLHCWHRLENLVHPIAPFTEPRQFVCCYCGATEWSRATPDHPSGHGDYLPPQYHHALPSGPCRPFVRPTAPKRVRVRLQVR